MRFRASEVADAVGGELIGDDKVLDGATQDSRTVTRGCLFVPLVAERDGHDFIDRAVANGAGAHLTSGAPGPGSAIRVADTAVALCDLGWAARASTEARVVAVTGSVGKTSVKDLTASVLSRGGPTHAGERSFNNEIGVPLTLLGAPDHVDFLVVEMGARAAGDITNLSAIARPDVGVVTTVGMAHTSEFGSLEAVARTKGELLDGLPPDGCAVLNADDDRVMDQAGRARCPILTFGDQGEVRARDVYLDGELRSTFRLESPWGRAEVRLAVHGAHMVTNALAAAAVGLFLGLPLVDVVAGLSEARLSPWRMEVGRSSDGLVVVNDAYNANPASMAAGLKALASLGVEGHSIAVVGLMAELGGHEASAHTDIADLADRLGIGLIAVGTELYGVPPLADVDTAVAHLAGLGLGDGDAVLVKGSRVAGLEVLAARLLDG